ncbi:MAG: hypothetical protein ACFFCG_00660 [Promethearchaeota archaeon]
MLYFLFFYQIVSGELLYEKEFQVDIDSHMDLFGSFFSALKSFVSNVANESIEELKTIGLGALIASIIRIPEADIDLVIIAEKDDKKEILKLSSELKSIVVNYKDLFLVDVIDSEKFENFDKKINEIILSHRNVLDPNLLIEKQKEVLKSIWDQRGKISDKIRKDRKDLENERTILINKLQKENNFLKKYSLCKLILELSDKLEDEKYFLEYQKKSKILANQIKDQKMRLKYYLSEIKKTLSLVLEHFEENKLKTGDFKYVYSNLYSFSSKLKNFASDEIYEEYYNLAGKLTYKQGITHEEFLLAVEKISKMDEDVESYLHFEA